MKKNQNFKQREASYREVSSTLSKLKFSLKILMMGLLLIILMKIIVYTNYTKELSAPPEIDKYLNRKIEKKAQPPGYDYYSRKIREGEEKRMKLEMDLLRKLNLPKSLMNNARTINSLQNARDNKVF